MWVLKPNWITHGRSHNLELGILSVDIDSISQRFLTSCFDGSICIWSLSSVLKENEIEGQLARVSQHEGPVNCVRWSPNAQFFASASDDSFVLVWDQSEVNTSENKEHWRAVLSLRAHTADVKEVAWSPDGKVLVSGGIDNDIFVWDIMRRTSVPIAALKQHTGFINGLTFDPLSQYLASLGDDSRIVIWDTHSWSVVSEVTKVFAPNRYQQTRRISFTPDGMHLVHAGPKRSNYKFTATVTGRDCWTQEHYLVGHCKAVSVVKACPVMFKGEKKPVWVVAVGGYDCALSIWKEDEEPIAIRDLFDSAVADITWTSDGMAVMACSSDGTIAVVSFDGGELGEPMTQLEQSQLVTGIYGTEPPKPLAVVKKEDKVLKSEAAVLAMNQTETRTTAGRRRIQPVLLSSPSATSMQFLEPAEAPPPQVVARFLEERPHAAPPTQSCTYPLSNDPEAPYELSVFEARGVSGDLSFVVSGAESSEVSAWQLVLKLDDVVLWSDLSAVQVTQVEGNQCFIAVVFADSTLNVYSTLGRSLIRSAAFGLVLFLQLTGALLFVVHGDRELVILDLIAQRLVTKLSLSYLEGEVVKASIGLEHVELTMRSGSVYTFNTELQLWIKSWPAPLNLEIILNP
jgi:protein HIRA/HIR1